MACSLLLALLFKSQPLFLQNGNTAEVQRLTAAPPGQLSSTGRTKQKWVLSRKQNLEEVNELLQAEASSHGRKDLGDGLRRWA